ncbi:F-box/kelch-repeat protein [Panicum miliaceum]|uniref:F-box/kelch-repeat protein n=1 Tax=Panicum miliaceum TaxID=4540 RepID=A0A3L6STW0_PANMI|nr:F-box/kelch-repeat protein [Panicum miliaceum]
MAARRSWADLHDELFAKIARRLPCLANRVHAARACRSWRDVVLQDPSPPELPWLLLPYQSAAALQPGATRRASFFCVLCDRAHRVAVPHFTGGARFFGAYPGGWLFLAYGKSYNHGLINLRTHESIRLPDDAITFTCGGLASQHRMLILAATLSAPPVPLEGCVAAAIVTDVTPQYFSGKPHITFWRMGSRLASPSSRLDADDAEDVIYHNGAFYFVTRRGDLLVCTPEFQNEAPMEQLRVRSEYQIATTVGLMDAGARYLVECRGELLLVLRDQPHQEVTSSFRVFRMTP